MVVRRKPTAVVADFDRQLPTRKNAAHRKPRGAIPASVFDRVVERFARGKANIIDFLGREAAHARKARNGLAS